jgi:N-acetylglucosaminyldiphosphoundecaprenol N-acetyl-beta-D-mannosaminyltransferase
MTIIDDKIICGSKFIETIKASNAENPINISFLNPYSYMLIEKRPELVKSIDYLFCDGALLSRLHSLFFDKVERASFDFSSIADCFFNYCIKESYRVAIIAATEDENLKAVNNLKTMYPGLNVVYKRDGYIQSDDVEFENLKFIKPDVIVLGMGTPFQEEFLVNLRNNANVKYTIAITCGGFITQTSIKSDYYHPVIKRLGLRWLQRMFLHKHVRDRVMKTYPYFIYSYLRSKCFK